MINEKEKIILDFLLRTDEHDFLNAINIISRIDFYDDHRVLRDLGYIYKTGNEHVNIDNEKSIGMYKRYIDLLWKKFNDHDSSAGFLLGNEYQYGEVVEKNESLAVKLYEKCAKNGHGQAAFHLSCLLQYGWCGLLQNMSLAREWLDIAVNAEWPEALYHKGLQLCSGNISPEGLVLIKRSADLDFWPAIEYLKAKLLST